jgi:hypothetical protein
MTPRPDADHAHDEEEDATLRQRVYRIADSLAELRMREAEDRLMIKQNSGAIEALKGSTATSSELSSAMELVNTKLDAIDQRIAPIQTGIYWAVGLILGGVLLAVLALVLNGPPPKLLP